MDDWNTDPLFHKIELGIFIIDEDGMMASLACAELLFAMLCNV